MTNFSFAQGAQSSTQAVSPQNSSKTEISQNKVAKSRVYLQNNYTGKVMTVVPNPTVGQLLIQSTKKNGATNQLFDISYTGDTIDYDNPIVRITIPDTNLAVSSDRQKNITLQPVSNSSLQMWRVSPHRKHLVFINRYYTDSFLIVSYSSNCFQDGLGLIVSNGQNQTCGEGKDGIPAWRIISNTPDPVLNPATLPPLQYILD